jgi:hypothetical protein
VSHPQRNLRGRVDLGRVRRDSDDDDDHGPSSRDGRLRPLRPGHGGRLDGQAIRRLAHAGRCHPVRDHASRCRRLESPRCLRPPLRRFLFSRQPRRRRIRHANSAHAAIDSDHRRPGSDRRVRGHGRHHADGREAARGRGQSPADPRLRAGHWAAGQDRWTHHRSELCLSRSPTRVGQGAGIDRDPSTSGASFYYCYCWSVRSSEASDMHRYTFHRK